MNTIRCCISCILPCGSLDVIRIVHVNGHVEEISGAIQASEIMKANPSHVLKFTSYTEDGVGKCPKIMTLSPNVQLQRGKIYFLVPNHNPSKAYIAKSSTSLHKGCNRSIGHTIAWRPCLEIISEATSDA
ncbi:hypothetical protein HanRHA438_Chr15g0709191 [Helianthus annuus]|uniref:Uncharacterized protein n=1 Tax=Helianthus annuus TaxID=4232 RepID=A0A251S8J7_HELAN|nr:hypothetical protein HanXRQr2_Chr15g0696781 [Helianthus annuus]KAJ0451474.1 hypothetical protein HanHA300_Chr15g0567951 [Helianthus annuus]KAJ0456007.1 hypothetical protein HanIR_Chr15g0757511 [Helianthus annuus]KAJ0473353.1 hypothetical protein HanHA89_Chr15g0617351 [Helianthus annuus]KAJ0648936.1 hypothetical protein HanLR1_Chr15g0578491 [Helianthus annuus]